MKDNGPVTQTEISLRDDAIIVSRTDARGILTFVNSEFIETSGFTEEQLVGAPHNIVRHPDMPQAAFADLWATLKQGRPWVGMVKNRCQNGDFYWVRANVTPVIEQGVLQGYISIRNKPGRDEVAAAEALYARMRRGNAGVRLERGRVLKIGALAALGRATHGVTMRLWAACAALLVVVLAQGLIDGGGLLSTLGYMALALGVAAGGGLFALRSVKGPLRRLEGVLQDIARGNFSAACPDEPVAEFQDTAALLQGMMGRLGYAALEKQEITRRAESLLRQEMGELTGVMEREVQEVVGEISGQTDRLAETASQLARVAEDLRGMAEEVARSVEVTAANVETVAGATEELEASGRQISSQVATSSALAESARDRADQASRSVTGASAASERIGEVVTMIRQIAAQTNLLALNATIEAARAGEAGKGFAVVAAEVKALARQTHEATQDIARRVQEIQGSTEAVVGALGGVTKMISQIDAANASVAAALAEQDSAIAEIARSAEEVARGVADTAERVSVMTGEATEVNEISTGTVQAVRNTDARVRDLRAGLIATLRGSVVGNRRRHPRIPVDIKATLDAGGGRSRKLVIADVSPSGALGIVADGDSLDHLTEGAAASVTIEHIGRFGGQITAIGERKVHLAFDETAVAADVAARLEGLLADTVAADERFRAAVRDGAGRIAALFEAAIQRGDITEVALFDMTYTPIPGTDPEQVMARFTDFTDRVLPPIQERMLELDKRVVFCAAVDRNGYLPTHNLVFSKPQREGERAWNTVNARNRRIFNDSAGRAAAACGTRGEDLLQSYERDMGEGKFVLMKEVDAPIRVRGKLWGALRLAYRP